MDSTGTTWLTARERQQVAEQQQRKAALEALRARQAQFEPRNMTLKRERDRVTRSQVKTSKHHGNMHLTGTRFQPVDPLSVLNAA